MDAWFLGCTFFIFLSIIEFAVSFSLSLFLTQTPILLLTHTKHCVGFLLQTDGRLVPRLHLLHLSLSHRVRRRQHHLAEEVCTDDKLLPVTQNIGGFFAYILWIFSWHYILAIEWMVTKLSLLPN